MLKEKEKACRDTLEAQERMHTAAMSAQQSRFDEILARVQAEMKNATDEMLRQRQKEFAESSNTNLGQIVNPLRETIEKMKQTMSDSTLKQTELSSEMKANIENMMRHSADAKESADELARVFKHRSKVQGDWGEQVLTNILHDSGLREGVEYMVQDNVKDEEGRNLRPDVIVKGADGTRIIIDSKVSLTAYSDYVGAEDDDQRKVAIKANHESLWKHVEELSKKNYAKLV